MLKKYNSSHVWVNGKRCYQVQGKVFPGVTTLLGKTKPDKDKFSLLSWRKRVGENEANRISQDACKRGSIIHEQIENTIQNIDFIPNESVDGFWQSMKNDVIPRVSNPQLIEGCVWHPFGFAGTVDCVADFDGELAIIDWKTSGKPKKEEWITDYKLQVSAYCAAVNRLYGLQIKKGVVAIALDNQPAQVFVIESEEMLTNWYAFKQRIKQYYS